MRKTDEAAEHAVAVESVREIAMPGTPDDIPLIPVRAGIRIEYRAQPIAIEFGVGGRRSRAEELPEFGVAREGADTGKFQLEQRKMRFIEIDRVDLSRLSGEIRQRVASTR